MEVLSPNIAIITAAGSGSRMGGEVRKQYRELGGIPVLIRTLSVFMDSPLISSILITAPEEDTEATASLIAHYFENTTKPWKVIAGGKERQDSVYNALCACPKDTGYVFIHDGVRPFINLELLQELYLAVQNCGAVIPGAPLKHTIKEVQDGVVKSTLDRSKLMQVFTPQVFEYTLILEAHQKAGEEGFYGTDDAALLERFGGTVQVLPCSEMNIKLTDSHDWALAEFYLNRFIKHK
ncbi:MAG: 2-C-methyl-D-erythritol 4-phosphate cytidylyltransferase [Candidatus Cloacimonadota bacterium]